MRVDELLRSLVRRPLALLLILVVAGAGAYVGWTRASNTYESSASVVIVPAAGADAAAGAPDNPLTRLDYSIAQLALVVSSQLDSDGVREQVVAAGGDGQFSADTLSSDNSAVAQLSPIISLSATSTTADGAQKAVAVLVDQAGAQLAAVQSASNVAAAAQAQVVVSAPPTGSAVVGNPQLRSAGVLGIAGGFLALLALVVLQPLFGRSRGPAAAAAPASSVRPRRDSAPAAGRFAPPPADAPTPDPKTRRRQETLRQMVRDDWQRSGSNVQWSRREQREAYQRAEERLAEKERRRRDLEAENVSRLDDFLEFRDHG